MIIHIVSGHGNYISNNHIVAIAKASETSAAEVESCYSLQVGALLGVNRAESLDVITVLTENESTQNTVLDSGIDSQVVMDKNVNAFRATPTIR